MHNASKDTIEDVIGSERYIRLREDLEKGKDEYWLVTYPQHIYEIFAILVHLNTELTRPRVNYFISKGLDLNTKVIFIGDEDNPSYPVLKTIENRNYKSTEALIHCGARLDLTDTDGFNALELALLGKEPADREDVHICEQLVYLIDRFAKVENTFTIASWIVEDCCEKYKTHSKYLKDVIDLCAS